MPLGVCIGNNIKSALCCTKTSVVFYSIWHVEKSIGPIFAFQLLNATKFSLSFPFVPRPLLSADDVQTFSRLSYLCSLHKQTLIKSATPALL